jgi:hypothetical protein
MKSWKVSDDSKYQFGIGTSSFGVAVTMYVEAGCELGRGGCRSRPTGLTSPRIRTPSFTDVPSYVLRVLNRTTVFPRAGRIVALLARLLNPFEEVLLG